MIYRYSKFVAIVTVLMLSYLFSAPTQAYTFVPSDIEFAVWPDYCKGAYVFNTIIGGKSKWVRDVGQEQRGAFAERKSDGIRGLHHACAGMIWLSRAREQTVAKTRKFMLDQALRETQYTFTRSNTQSRFFVDVSTQKAMIQYEHGDSYSAINILTDLIGHQPKNPIPYSALAVIHRKLGHLEDAKQALLAGDEAVNGRSPEIKYNLGLVSLELGEIDQARAFAESAYELGYPLPGLRLKLEAALRKKE